MRRHGFTLTDLLVVVVMLAILLAVAVPWSACRSREASNRIRCASNLRQIGLAMKMYANDEVRTNAYPRTIYQADAPPVVYTNPNCPHPFAGPNVPGPNDVTAAIFLTLRTQDITHDLFICPSSLADRFHFDAGKTIKDYSNFRSQRELSYSFQNPYPTKDSVAHGFQYNDAIAPDFAIAADMNPGVPELLTTKLGDGSQKLRQLNSPNHDYDGQNILYADGRVEWQVNPFAGASPNGGNGLADNIFTFGPNPAEAHPGVTGVVGIIGPPAGANDSILLPVWDPTVPMPALEHRDNRTVWGAFLLGGVLILIVGAVVYVGLQSRRRGT